MNITKEDASNIRRIGMVASTMVVPFEDVVRAAETRDFKCVKAYVQRCRLSNGWEVCCNYEFQRPELIVRHLSVLFQDATQGTVVTMNRIMKLLHFDAGLKDLPSWTEAIPQKGFVVHVLEPVNGSVEELARPRIGPEYKSTTMIGTGAAANAMGGADDA